MPSANARGMPAKGDHPETDDEPCRGVGRVNIPCHGDDGRHPGDNVLAYNF